jgi:hypothetical protein
MRLQSFEGAWEVYRIIEDVRAGRAGRFTGRARFEPVEGGLAYREEGTLEFEGAAPMRASRNYIWRDGGGGTVEVWFESGGFFHRFSADEPAPAATHDCPPDRYRVRYDFAHWPRWQAEWRVSGPRKDYQMVSRYRRAGNAG